MWARSSKPIHMALLGGFICTRMASKIMLGQTALRERARELEQWAIHSLNMAPEQQDAYHILEMSVTKQSNFSLMDLAVETRMKAFLQNRHCVSLMNLWWRGGFKNSLYTLPPLFLWRVVFVQVRRPSDHLHPCRSVSLPSHAFFPAALNRSRPPSAAGILSLFQHGSPLPS